MEPLLTHSTPPLGKWLPTAVIQATCWMETRPGRVRTTERGLERNPPALVGWHGDVFAIPSAPGSYIVAVSSPNRLLKSIQRREIKAWGGLGSRVMWLYILYTVTFKIWRKIVMNMFMVVHVSVLLCDYIWNWHSNVLALCTVPVPTCWALVVQLLYQEWHIPYSGNFSQRGKFHRFLEVHIRRCLQGLSLTAKKEL